MSDETIENFKVEMEEVAAIVRAYKRYNGPQKMEACADCGVTCLVAVVDTFVRDRHVCIECWMKVSRKMGGWHPQISGQNDAENG